MSIIPYHLIFASIVVPLKSPVAEPYFEAVSCFYLKIAVSARMPICQSGEKLLGL